MPIINRIRDVAVAMSVASAFGAAAQVFPVRYQLCEPDVPPSGRILSIQTNYRYPASVPRRQLQGFQTYRCEIAQSQSTDAFAAFGTCPWAIAGCLPDQNGVCQDHPVLKGPHVLAEIDLVIEALRHVDGTPMATNTLSASEVPRSAVDWSGHRLVDTYLDRQRHARQDVRTRILQAMDAL